MHQFYQHSPLKNFFHCTYQKHARHLTSAPCQWTELTRFPKTISAGAWLARASAIVQGKRPRGGRRFWCRGFASRFIVSITNQRGCAITTMAAIVIKQLEPCFCHLPPVRWNFQREKPKPFRCFCCMEKRAVAFWPGFHWISLKHLPST